MSTITVRGQVTIPEHIRDELGLKPGSEVDFVRQADGRYVVTPIDPALSEKSEYLRRLESVTGILDLGMSTDEYMKILRGDDDSDLT